MSFSAGRGWWLRGWGLQVFRGPFRFGLFVATFFSVRRWKRYVFADEESDHPRGIEKKFRLYNTAPIVLH